MKRHHPRLRAFAIAFGTIALASSAFAGPPLLCHPYDIGSARSLPWNDSGNWMGQRADYKLENLISDTDALLTPATPIVVRMETLRRAAIYASVDATLAKDFLSRLNAKVESASAAGHPDALALLDAAYVTEAFRMMSTLKGEFTGRAPGLRAAIGNGDGYALIAQAITAKPNDAGLQFAAALIAADKGDRSRYLDHASKARAGAPADMLLTKNLDHVQ